MITFLLCYIAICFIAGSGVIAIYAIVSKTKELHDEHENESIG